MKYTAHVLGFKIKEVSLSSSTVSTAHQDGHQYFGEAFLGVIDLRWRKSKGKSSLAQQIANNHDTDS